MLYAACWLEREETPLPPKKRRTKQPVWSQSVTIQACGSFISESPDKTQGGIILYSWLCKSMSKIDRVSLWVKTGGRSKSSQLCGHRWAGEQVNWHPSSASQQPDLPLPHWCGENLIPARTSPPRCSGVRSHQGAVKTGGWTMVFVREHLSFSLICVTWHVCRPGLKLGTANGSAPERPSAIVPSSFWAFPIKRRRDAHIKATVRISRAHLVNVDGLKRHFSPSGGCNPACPHAPSQDFH